MEIKIKNFSMIYIVDIAGEIDLYNYNKLKEIIVNLKNKGIKKFIIDFQNTTYIDSSGIGALIYIHSILKDAKLNFYICNLHGPVKRVIELTKLIGFLPITETLQDAVKKMNDSLTGETNE